MEVGGQFEIGTNANQTVTKRRKSLHRKKSSFCSLLAILIIILDLSPCGESGTVVQSKICNSNDRTRQRQCFSKIPRDVYEIAVGDTLVMNCKVDRLNGQLQWRANSFLLGYDRRIPSSPRYSMIGNSHSGEYNLQIIDAQIDDAGEYECQVTPNGIHPLLRRKTKVVVLVKPEQPNIFSTKAEIINGHTTVADYPKGAVLSLNCESRNGVPRPNFKWRSIGLKGNNVLRSNSGRRIKVTVNDDHTKSTLNISVRNLRNGDIIQCGVSNAATKKSHDPGQRTLKTQINVTVNERPGEPQLSGFEHAYNYTEGSQLTATCKASPIGNPQAGLFWRWHLAGQAGTEDVPSRYYSFRNDGRNQLVSELHIPQVLKKYHNAQLICETQHPVGPPRKKMVTVFIRYAPERVTITSTDSSDQIQMVNHRPELIVLGHEGQTKLLTCTTSAFYGKAIVKWVALSPGRDERLTNQIHPKYNRIQSNDTTNTLRNVSTIEVVIRRANDRSYIDCQAWGEGEIRVDARARLDIVYPPEKPPIITGYPSSGNIRLKKGLTLTCISNGGNPLPNLTWYQGTIPLSGQEQNTIGSQRSLKLKFVARKKYNRKKIHCKAESVATNGGLTSQLLPLNVIFPPNGVTVTGGRVTQEGNRLTVMCQANSSNPGATILWRRYDCPPAEYKNGVAIERPDCGVDELQGINEAALPGEFEGIKSRSRLELRPTWADHNKYIECQAGNTVYGKMKIHDRIRLNITFAPKFPKMVQGEHRVVQKGSSGPIKLEPIANPAVTTYTWYRNSVPFQASSSMETHQGRLILKSVRVEDMGNYTIVARNDLGEARFTFFLNITYPPILDGPADVQQTMTPNADQLNGELTCSAQANPADPSSAFIWNLPDKDVISGIGNADPATRSISCNEGRFQKVKDLHYYLKCSSSSSNAFRMSSTLMIYSVSEKDVGIYTCIVSNGVGTSIVKTIEFTIPFKPIPIVSPQYDKAAGEIGQTVKLVCRVRGEPRPNFHWSRISTNRRLNIGNKYKMSVKKLSISVYQGTLEITRFKKTDYGEYKCQAENKKGTSLHSILVTGIRSPDKPTNLRLLNSTSSSVKIAWTQGFNGGLLQTFLVRWRRAGAGNLFNYRDVASDTSKSDIDTIITGLDSDTEYSIGLLSKNAKPAQSESTDLIKVKTKSIIKPGHDFDTQSKDVNGLNQPDDNALLIIVAACVFGFVILVINILVISFLVKRRGVCCQRRPKNNPNTGYVKADVVEMYPRNNGYARGAMPDDQKTFSSYDAGSDELKEDLLKKHEGRVGTDSHLYPLLDPRYPYSHLTLTGSLPRPTGQAGGTNLHPQPALGRYYYPHHTQLSGPMNNEDTGTNSTLVSSLNGGPHAILTPINEGVAYPGQMTGPGPIDNRNIDPTEDMYVSDYPPPIHSSQLTRAMPMMTASYHEDPEFEDNQIHLYQNTGSLRLPTSYDVDYGESPYHNLRGPYLNTVSDSNHRHSYAEELRRVQYGGPITHVQGGGSTLPRFHTLYHPLQGHYRLANPQQMVACSPSQLSPASCTGSLRSPLLYKGPPPPERTVSRQVSLDRLADVIPPPQDFSRHLQADVVVSHQQPINFHHNHANNLNHGPNVHFCKSTKLTEEEEPRDSSVAVGNHVAKGTTDNTSQISCVV